MACIIMHYYASCNICVCSLFCSIQIISLHFLLNFLKNKFFILLCSVFFACSAMNLMSPLSTFYNICLFGTKHRLNLGCSLDESLSGEAMALKVIHKVNSRFRFLYRKTQVLVSASLQTVL